MDCTVGLRRAARQDGNAKELVEFARNLGMLVEYIGEPVDLLVAYAGSWYPVEIKADTGKYTIQQREFIYRAAEAGAPVVTWRTKEDIERMLYAEH